MISLTESTLQTRELSTTVLAAAPRMLIDTGVGKETSITDMMMNTIDIKMQQGHIITRR